MRKIPICHQRQIGINNSGNYKFVDNTLEIRTYTK
jgi:hypothetical protein